MSILERHRVTTRAITWAVVAFFAASDLLVIPLARAQTTGDCSSGGCDNLGALIGQVPQGAPTHTEAELDALRDGNGNKTFIDATTFAGRRAGWGRNSVEQEAVFRLQCIDEPNVEINRAELYRILGADNWDEFRELREPSDMLAFTLNQDPNIAPWNDESHARREQVGYVWFGVSTSRGALQYDRRRLEINGQEIRGGDRDPEWMEEGVIDDEAEIKGSIDYFDDQYLDTNDFRLTTRVDPFTGQSAPANVRVRARYDNEDNPTPQDSRLLVQSKIAIPCPPDDPRCPKTTAKRDSRTDSGTDQAGLDAMSPAAIRGLQSWDNQVSIAMSSLWEQLKSDGLTFDAGAYEDVLVLQPATRVHSIRTRYHMDDVRPDQILRVHNDAGNYIDQLRAELDPGDLDALRAYADQQVAQADPSERDALRQAFDTTLTALGSDTWLVDSIAARTSLTPQQINDSLTALRTPRGGRVNTVEDVDRLRLVSHTLSDLYHEVGTALGHNDREATAIVTPAADDDDAAERFEVWLENQGTSGATNVGTIAAADASGEQTRIPTTKEGVTLDGTFDGLQIRMREADGPDPDADTGWGDWVTLTPGMQVPPVYRGDERLEARFEIRPAPGQTPSGSVTVNAHLPSRQATDFRRFSEWRPFYDQWVQLSQLPDAQRAQQLETLAGRPVSDAEFAEIGAQLKWEDLRRAYKRIEAGGTAAKALWFNRARAFYVPRASNSFGNLLIDTTDLAGFYPHRDGDDTFNAGDNDFGDDLMSAELVNEVQIELTNPVAEATNDRVTELTNGLLEEKAGMFLNWAAANGRLPNTTGSETTVATAADAGATEITLADASNLTEGATVLVNGETRTVNEVNGNVVTLDRGIARRAAQGATVTVTPPEYLALWNQLSNGTLDDVRAVVNGVNEYAAAQGAPWAQGGDHAYPLTVSEFRQLSHKRWFEDDPNGGDDRLDVSEAILTDANRQRPVRGDNNNERMLTGAQFIFDQYVEAQNVLAEAKADFVIGVVNDALDRARRQGNTDVPECSQWQWAPSTKSKGTRSIELKMERDGFTPPTPPTPPTPRTSADEEPNDSIDAVNGNDTRGNFLAHESPFEGHITNPGDQDYYRVVVPSGSTLTVSMQPPSGQDYDLYLYDSGGQRLDRSWNGGDRAEEVSLTADGNGTVFYVRVNGWRQASSADPYTLSTVIDPPPAVN